MPFAVMRSNLKYYGSNKNAASSNPSIQCSVCGKWKRLHGKDAQGVAIQRFYPCCGDNGEHEHVNPVCTECCETNCPYNKTHKHEPN